MSKNKVICTKNDVDYKTIRKAMCSGARTEQELAEMVGVCTKCEGCKSNLDSILTSVCGCKGTSLETVVRAVRNGADTVEKVVGQTGAGSKCERCIPLIENIIELGR